MLHGNSSRGAHRPGSLSRAVMLALPLLFTAGLLPAFAQTGTPADSPASIPARVGPLPTAPTAAKPAAASTQTHISEKQAREADDAYLDGAKQIQHKDLAAAERSFAHAVQLNPNNRDYALALIVARETRVTELVQSASKARLLGDAAHADALLAEARAIDPNNPVIAQHFDSGTAPASKTSAPRKPGLFSSTIDPLQFPAENIASTLAGPVELDPTPGARDVHLHGDPQSAIRSLYRLFGINVSFDSSVSGGAPVDLDMNHVTFAEATHVLDMAAHVFAVPVQPKTALIAKDTQENRDALMPQVEETVYLRGRTNDQMQELANVARNVFDIKQVTASATGGYMLLRGDPNVLRQVNATYADMLDGDSEVLFDVNLYEVDATLTRNIGAQLPTSAGIFSVAAEAQSLVTANQSLINQAIASGLLKLTGSPLQNLITEVEFLIASGTVTASQYTNLLGLFGNGLTLAGLFLGSSTSFNLALASTDTRLLDALQVRSSNGQAASFRAGTRYPVVTAIYSSGISSSLAGSLSGLNINGTSVSSLLSQYLGTSSVSVPQFQFEDLGITLKMTPHILQSDEVSVGLEMKIEALAGASINSVPILNNRTLTSTITIPGGQTAMLATLVNTTETKALNGLPGLSELPGFQGTDQDREKDSTELLITITPHIVRSGALHIVSRRLAAIKTVSAAQ